MKLRLLLFEECDRQCLDCCNKDWDLTRLLKTNDFRGYDEILLTGGEPMLHPDFLSLVINRVRLQTGAPIYLYTAKVDDWRMMNYMLLKINGLTVTLHEQADVEPFNTFNNFMQTLTEKSLRLNVFEGVDVTGVNLDGWKVKRDMKWIKKCPLPTDEIFRRFSL